MKVFVTGAAGQLGYDMLRMLAERGHTAIASDIAPVCTPEMRLAALNTAYIPLDITDAAAVDRAISAARPDAVIHCAAWTAVDAAEDAENAGKVHAINVEGTQYIAQACKAHHCKLVYISTDYVFDGQGTAPWQPVMPSGHALNAYGQSKLEGERVVAHTLDAWFIVRIAWVFGINGSNFVKTMLNAGQKRSEVRVVNDQIGTPTYTADLARLLADMIETERYGIYHATNEGGYISWYDFVCEIYRQAGLATTVLPVTTEAYGLSKAARPANSRLDKQKLTDMGFEPLPPWQDALKRFLQEINGEVCCENK